MSKLFLDTNIILDFLDSRRVHHEKAKSLVKDIIINQYEIVISEDMLSTIYYIHKNREEALSFFETILREWRVVSYGQSLILDAIAISKESKADFEDTLQCLCARANKCVYLVTSDKGFIDCGVEIIDYNRYFSSDLKFIL